MSIYETQKRRGRPATGESPQVRLRFSIEQLVTIDRFSDVHKINRSEAIRQLVDHGLRTIPIDQGGVAPNPR